MQEIICDGELGIMGDSAQARLKRLGIEPKVRAPGQHARFIERRGAILRQTLHCLESQLAREGVVSKIDHLLSEAVFAGNALIHVGGVTPYQCIYGRTPVMLPPLPDEGSDAYPELSDNAERVRHHVRVAALEAMIQATSLARTSRALKSKSIAATEVTYKRGDVVDYHRPSPKDVVGWHGPCQVIESKPEEGIVIIQINGKPKPCRLQDVRHTLFAHVSFDCFIAQTTAEALHVIRFFVSNMSPRKHITLGLVHDKQGQCHLSQATEKHAHVLQALDFLIESVWNFDECHAVRLGSGCPILPHMEQVTHSTLIFWNAVAHKQPEIVTLETSAVNLKDITGDYWINVSFVQLLHNSDQPAALCDSIDATAYAHEEESSGQPVLNETHSERLSTIPEGSNEDVSETQDEEVLFAAFAQKHFDLPQNPEDIQDLRNLWHLYQDTVSEFREEAPSAESFPLVFAEPEDFWYQPDAAFLNHSQDHLHVGEAFLTELLVDPSMTNCFIDSQKLAPDEEVAIRIYNATSKVEVVKRASDVLTPEEFIKHKAEIDQATLEELRIWHDYGCFKMVPRQGARNIIDSRFVTKWKVKDPSRPFESRIIRRRMTLRGFKDWCADQLDSHAATASKMSQRMLISEAACNPSWSFLSIDINKAFLQGVTYSEMSAATGEEERVVHFTLPPGSAAFLRKLPGFEHYDERYYVLKCVKPGTGCKDAPKAFSIKLASVTRSVGLKPISTDPECEVKHKNGRLVLIIAKHVDDIKITGEESEVQALLQALEHTFGKIDRNDNDFTCVGIHHFRDNSGSITLDQHEYIKSMNPIRHPDLVGSDADADCSEAVTRLFWSLLGAVAYTLLTQHWISVYVIALQRNTHCPKYQHIRKLNSLLKVLQKQKATIVFPCMDCCRHIMTFSDASFCKETDLKGYGMRGTVILRLGTQHGKPVCHLLDATSQSLKLVTRSTFSAETLAAVGSTDVLIPVMIAMNEIQCGPFTTEQLREMRENSKFVFDSTLVIDAFNLYQHWTDNTKKLPSEKSLYPHLWWLRDTTRCAPKRLRWCDTRDMLADICTKGTVQRGPLLDAMIGTYQFKFEFKDHIFKPVSIHASQNPNPV